MKLKEIINGIENIAPLSLQEEWDNCGFQIKVHNDFDEINNVLVCLEITTETINEAISNNVQLIVTHHPLYFNSFKCISVETYNGIFTKRLIENNISVYSSHTAFDICEGGNNDYFGELLGINNISLIESDPDKIMRFGDFNEALKLNDLIELIEEKFNINKAYFNYSGPKDLLVKRISWVTGAGADYLVYAKDINSDLFITGDLSYHQARDSKELNLPTLGIGHYASEMIFNANMKNILNNISTESLNIISSNLDINPYNEI